jgi:uncharacterized protein
VPVQLAFFVVTLVAVHAAIQQPLWYWFWWSISHPNSPVVGNWAVAAFYVLDALAVLAVYRWLVIHIEQRRATELGLAGMPAGLGAGFMVGIGLITIVCLILIIAGAGTIDGPQGGAAKVLSLKLAYTMTMAVVEEVLFRGAIFRIAERCFGTIVALMLSAILFGIVHLANPHASTVSAIAIALEAGLLLGLVYSATRNLWMPIGVHIGWNFGEGEIFGAPVSGGQGSGWMRLQTHGPEILTGGDFGPEGSLIAIGVSLIAALYCLWLTHRRGQWCGLRLRWRA